MLPCIVGSSATLTRLVKQFCAAYQHAHRDEPLREDAVREEILAVATRKAHAGRPGAFELPLLNPVEMFGACAAKLHRVHDAVCS